MEQNDAGYIEYKKKTLNAKPFKKWRDDIKPAVGRNRKPVRSVKNDEISLNWGIASNL